MVRKNLEPFFNPRSIAVIGASRKAGKVGHSILKNLITSFKQVYPINPKAERILGKRCYASVLDVKQAIDLAVIAVPAKIVPSILDECGRKGIKHIIIISSGFSEVGNVKLEEQVIAMLHKYDMACIGPNCLGIFDSQSMLNTLFLPADRMSLPEKGNISFISQSGALGSALLDLASLERFGFAKFISYGNAVDIDESDLLLFLGGDKQTSVICLYIEAVKNGKKFMKAAAHVSKYKPIIAIKGGITEAGKRATLSHTGSLAGSAAVYKAAFKQSGIVYVNSLREMLDAAKIFSKLRISPQGRRVQIITNGGGYGIVATDEAELAGLRIAKPSKKTILFLKKRLPTIAAIGNPIDVLGDADMQRYEAAINACMQDAAIDAIMVIILPQTPGIDIKDVAKFFTELELKKPIVGVITGSHFSERLKKEIERSVPFYRFPADAVAALLRYFEYYSK